MYSIYNLFSLAKSFILNERLDDETISLLEASLPIVYLDRKQTSTRERRRRRRVTTVEQDLAQSSVVIIGFVSLIIIKDRALSSMMRLHR